jgi:hypothetical protein
MTEMDWMWWERSMAERKGRGGGEVDGRLGANRIEGKSKLGGSELSEKWALVIGWVATAATA